MLSLADLKGKLNPEQLAAATRLWTSNKAALQVIAGAGSGKSTTLVAAVFAAVDAGFTPERIAVITFSRRAAHELTERFTAQNFTPGYCGTMHALAWRLIRATGSRPRLILHAERIRGEIARRLFPELAHIPEKILLSGTFLNSEARARLQNQYAARLEANNEIDFDTMIARATASGMGSGKFDVVLVDEFQDTSPDQVVFINSLMPQKLFVVGDDWQSIYRFRGADVSITRDFTQQFAASERAYLVSNYRSGKSIVRLGNRVIRESGTYVKKKLRPTHPRYHKPVLFFAPDAEKSETVWMRYLAAYAKNAPHLKNEKVTVLVRTNGIRLELERHKPENFEILTIHKSKGLEFDNVIVFGVAEHLLPHRDNDFDEEVRILYVALTRARRYLGFVGWERNGMARSAFLPLLMRKCRLIYI